MPKSARSELVNLDLVEAELVDDTALAVVDADVVYDGIVYDLDDALYHAHHALSSTQVKWLDNCPAIYKHNKENAQPHIKAFDLGTAAHTMVLGTGSQVVCIPDNLLSGEHRTVSSTAAKKWVAEARAGGFTPIKQVEFKQVLAMAESVLAHPEARRRLEGGTSEVSVFAHDGDTDLDLRCRFDRLDDQLRWALDLKTSADAGTPNAFGRTVWKRGYHLSRAHYLDTLQLVTGQRPEMLFIVVEKDAPYLTSVHRLSNDQIEMGETGARAARARLRACLNLDLWPGRDSGIQVTETPMGQVYDFQDRYGRGD